MNPSARSLITVILLFPLVACANALTSTDLPQPAEASTPTPPPTVTSSPSPIPVTKATIASCPVSSPNVSKSPNEYYISTTDSYQNADGTLFTHTAPQGAVIFARGGPGFILPDGSLAMKWGWWRGVRGELTIEGRRLDAPAPPLRAEITEGYGDIGFLPVSLVFPTQGCWEVTGKVDNAQLTFVTLVVQVPFRMINFNWLPEGFISSRRDISELPESLREIYDFSRGELITESIEGKHTIIDSHPAAAQQRVTVNGHPAICVQGAFDEKHQWQSQADAAILGWIVDGSSYRISHKGLGLRCDDLLRIPDQPP